MSEKTIKIGKIFLISLSLVGIVIMGYLISLHYSPEEGSFCNLGEGLSCDIVNKSVYSKVLGIPVSILGLLYFLGVLGASIWSYNKSTLKKIIFLSIVFLGPSLYLTGTEIFILKNICIFCEISKVLILAIIIVSWLVLRPDHFNLKSFVSAVVLAILLGGVVYAIHAGAGSKRGSGEFDTFAKCLYDKGMRMYGSVTCSFCAKQRSLFGDSSQYIQEVECDPRNPDNEAERCIAKNISRTPTWILEDEEGSDVYRFDSGVQSMEKLSEISGCSLSSTNL